MEIGIERYTQLIRAEQDANCLKALIAEKFENYGMIDREDLKMLYHLFIGKGDGE